MIIVKLCLDDEIYCDGKICDYKNKFDDLLDTRNTNRKYPPFRDPESQRLLKESYGISFVNNDDWYSVIVDGRRMAISCLYESIKFALVAIFCSRQGLYTRYWGATEKIWKVLADMPFDILLAVPISEIGIFSWIRIDTDCKLINFPYNNQKIEVYIKTKLLKSDDFYESVSDNDAWSSSHWLFRGKDEKYYMYTGDIEYALQYYWKEDIEGIIKYINQNNENRIYLGRIQCTFNVYELGEILNKNTNLLMELDYLFNIEMLEQMYQEAEIDEQELQAALLEVEKSDKYEKYLYFRDTFKIISYLETVPPDPRSRKLPILMVDKNRDGTYFIHGTLTCKYPEFHELVYEMIIRRSPNRDCYALIVDVDELLSSVEDMKNTVCGFKVMADSLEIFEKKEGLRIFGDILKEACDSGKYTVSKEFY